MGGVGQMIMLYLRKVWFIKDVWLQGGWGQNRPKSWLSNIWMAPIAFLWYLDYPSDANMNWFLMSMAGR